MQKEFLQIEDLKLWGKNPRSITRKSFTRLKKHLKKYGQYKPILVNQDNVVVGGNMRVRAFADLGIKKVWVSIVNTKNEGEMLEYALSDNETFGFWNDQQLAELIQDIEIDVGDFKVDVKSVDLDKLLKRFGPNEDSEDDKEDPDIDFSEKVKCPRCGHVFKHE